MHEKHQWMPNTLFGMAALCDRIGLDQPRDLLLETALAIADYLNDSDSGAGALPMADCSNAGSFG